ncbi:glycosyltransferase [Candidatus Amesbacteria bacterium]|nr:glycosyltransferase [Candidatus Amesbacteria bacterium]
MKQSLSVVVPAYNEEGNIVKCITTLNNFFQKSSYDYEIIVVDDGSKDKTGELAHQLAKKYKKLVVVHNRPNRGYGGSLKAGFAKAKNEFICFIPGDNQFDIFELPKMLEVMINEQADLISGIRVNDNDPMHRKFVRWLWNTGIRAMFGYLGSDIDCGFKIFKRDVLKKVNIPSDGAMIDTQLLAGMRARGMKIVEIPTTHLPRMAGEATGGNLRVWIKAWKELAVFWWQLKNELMVERGLAVFRWEAILMTLILLVAGFTRMYKIDQYMTFLGDEGRDAMVVRDMVIGKKFTLLGPGTSVGNMYLGPLYYYLLLIPLSLSRLSPVGPAVFVGIVGIATVGLLWWWGRQLFGRTSALLISIIYSLSPTIIIYSRSSWNPNIMPFFALLAMYGTWKIWKFGYWRWLVISAISLAFVLNSHYLGLLLIPVMTLFVILAPRPLDARRNLLIPMISFLILMSPLLFFDLRHDFMNFKSIKLFFTDRQTTVNLKVYKAIPNLWTIWEMIISSMLVAKNNLYTLTTSVMMIIGLGWVLKSKVSKDFWLVALWLLFGLVGLGLYKQHIYDHYFGFLYPAIFLLLGYILSKINKYLAFLLTSILLIINILNNPFRFTPNNQWSRTQEVADFIINKSNSKPFNLALLSKGNYDQSYRYALDIKNSQYKTLREQNTDQLFVICEDPDCKPVGNPLWEIAGFGWVKIDDLWTMPWGVKIYKLGHYEK